MNLSEQFDHEISITSSDPVCTILMERSFSDWRSLFQKISFFFGVECECGTVWTIRVPPSPADARWLPLGENCTELMDLS